MVCQVWHTTREQAEKTMDMVEALLALVLHQIELPHNFSPPCARIREYPSSTHTHKQLQQALPGALLALGCPVHKHT